MTKKQCSIIDSTLREGEQAPEVTFTDSVRRTIIYSLYRLGIDEIELGIATPVHSYLIQLVRDAQKIIQKSCRIALWSRCRKEDIDFAADCRPDVLSLSIPVSDLHIRKRLQRDRAWVKRTLAASIRQAFSLGIPYVAVGLEDSSRADQEFLLEVVEVAEKNGAMRIRLADTVGTCSPAMLQHLVGLVKKRVTVEIGVHCHNDFGMATANSIAAIESGAGCLDATILGIGERAGNCRLEEVVGFMALIRQNHQYQPQLLPELCRYVAGVTGIQIPGNHPIIGDDIFTCETGLHQHGLSVAPETYEPYEPHRVGTVRKLNFGSKTGVRAIGLQLIKNGLYLDDIELRSLTNMIYATKQVFTEEQLYLFAVRNMRQLPSGN